MTSRAVGPFAVRKGDKYNFTHMDGGLSYFERFSDFKRICLNEYRSRNYHFAPVFFLGDRSTGVFDIDKVPEGGIDAVMIVLTEAINSFFLKENSDG